MDESIQSEVISGETPATPVDTQNNTPAVSTVEQEARTQGWVPQDEWAGDPDKWRPAKEYVDRGELLRKIEQQSRSIKETNKALQTLAEHHKKVREVEYQRALNDLKTQRKAAFIDQDLERVAELDEDIDYVKEQQKQVLETPVIPEQRSAPPALTAWEQKNIWYKSDRAMTSFANDLAAELRQDGYDLQYALAEIDKQVRQEFPHKFRNTSKPAASAVEGSGKGRSTGGSKDFQLTDEQRRVMHKFIKAGAVKDEQEYVDQLKAIS